MILLTGPAGSGKTARVLKEFREALRAPGATPRLLVPTATLSEHLRNELARDGVVFRSKSVSTLAQFAAELAPYPALASSGHLHLMVEAALARLNLPEFAKVRDLAGVHARLAATIADLDAAGCAPRHLARVRKDLAPFRDALTALWEDVERQLGNRRKVTRGAQLCTIAGLVSSIPLPTHIWLDGFAQLAPPEMDLICALGARTRVLLTLPEEGVKPDLAETLRRRGFREEKLTGGRAAQEVFLVPETAERECEEIARRILLAGSEGMPFREMGVIVRQPAKYEPLLRATLERFGIPAHFYFGEPLALNSAGRLLSELVEALLSGWDHKRTLDMLRLMPILGASNRLDTLEIEVRKTFPGTGLDSLESRATGRGLRRVFKQLRALESWREARFTPAGWAAQFEKLQSLCWPGYLADRGPAEQVRQLREQAAGLAAFTETIAEAADWWLEGPGTVGLTEFWRVAKTLIGLARVKSRNRARQTVHVIHALEARQWDFSMAFVCGLAEREFPAQNVRDPFLSDAALHDLARQRIPVRTAMEKDAEEFGLFEAVRVRASQRIVLTYPRLDARGQRNLQSIFLKGRTPEEIAPPVRPRLAPHIAQWRQPVVIQSPDLIAILAAQQKVSVTNLESLLQCPFQFFARRALRVTEMPERPEDRLNFLLQGNIAHEVLRDWFQDRSDIDGKFQRIFARVCDEKHVLPGFRTERLRRAMLLSLRAFVNDTTYPEPARSEMEMPFEFAIDETLSVTGKLDRIDQLPDGRWVVVDYKFSTAASTKVKVDDESKLQGPLYALALSRVFGRSPSAMVYASLRDRVSYYGWGSVPNLRLETMSPDWMTFALDRVTRAVAEFRSGVVHPRPLNTDPCRYCTFRDACRLEQHSATAGAGV